MDNLPLSLFEIRLYTFYTAKANKQTEIAWVFTRQVLKFSPNGIIAEVALRTIGPTRPLPRASYYGAIEIQRDLTNGNMPRALLVPELPLHN